MCGICGFTGKGSSKDLKKMTHAIFHRGPDQEGLWHDNSKAVYLGHTRLSIIDIKDGTQPMWTHDQSIGVIFNGEIYNHKTLRDELVKNGHKFFTDHSDTEVLLHGYRQWGSKLPDKLNGMWAFAIYDKKKERLFISRDRFGKKPLFYCLQDKIFAFASELTSLISHSLIKASVSKKSLKKYFAFGYIPAPNSLYHRIYKLPGGCNLLFDLNNFSIKIEKYWDFILEPFQIIPENPEKVWGEELQFLLKKAVQQRLISDVPLGLFLSGGIDSSAITAFACSAMGNKKLKTFSIGFEEQSFDESKYAKSIANLFNTDHHQKILSIKRGLDILPEITALLDEPMGDNSLIPTYMLAKETKKHVTVALGGDGGDELFAGYDPFRALNMAKIYSALVPRPVHRAIRMMAGLLPVSHGNMSFDFKLKRTLRGLSYTKKLWNAVWLGTLEPEEIDELFNEETDIEEVYSEAIEYWDACPQDNLVDKTLQFYTKLYLQDEILIKADRASMMNSLEVRSPFLDIDLVDFVRKIPNNWKYRNGQTKYILKKALEPVLPDSILYRPKKGFGVPVGSWLKKELLNIDSVESNQCLNISFVQKKIFEHRKNKVDHRAFLWNYWLLNKFL